MPQSYFDSPNLIAMAENSIATIEFLKKVIKRIEKDENRIVLLGHSMGGAGVIFLGQKYKDKWATIAAIAPAAFMMLQNRADFLTPIRDAGIPLMMVQGGKDKAVPPEYANQWVEAIKELKMSYEYIELPGGDHGTVIGDGMPDIFRFFAEHTKGGT